MERKKAIVIGAGFSGIAAATSLAVEGFDVTVLEKNSTPGGRARYFEEEGHVFDMGPSWYWMPDVFDRYFERFGAKTADYYDLKRLDPSYSVFFGQQDRMDIPAKLEALCELFESYEQGSGARLKEFLKQAAYKYEVGINDLVYKPGRSITEFMSPSLLLDMLRMDIFQSFHKHIRKFFSNEKLLKLMEFPILFLGATPQNTPALYSLMNYADISLGTWYPMGGMFKIVEGMVSLAKKNGVNFLYDHAVSGYQMEGNRIVSVQTSKGSYDADIVIGGADYHHMETKLLPKEFQSYSKGYWDSRVMAPSSLLFYLGLNKKLEGVSHHMLFFDEDFGKHAEEIYEKPQWPTKPLFYASVPSVTDPSVAPEGKDTMFVLIPTAPGLEDSEEVREKYFDVVMDRFERLTGNTVRDAITIKRTYAHRDFVQDYNAFKGNAYGLANTLRQTAILKPSLKSKKVSNLYYTGQLTTPGPGVPPSLISGQVVAKEVQKAFNTTK
ncbi:phytoene desaturase family protein [Limibacter armeniacum]|uniref:phytoene desaturase family protein n=1 Tax=Limibacter armeniacum TaxID=466084 RepID=UPI002FE6C3F3